MPSKKSSSSREEENIKTFNCVGCGLIDMLVVVLFGVENKLYFRKVST